MSLPVAASVAVVTLATPLHAQQESGSNAAPVPAPEPELAVEELVLRALQNSPQIPVARRAQEAARQRLAALRAAQNPVLGVVAGIGSREARDEEVILSQPLDVFGRRRAQAGVAAAELRRAQAESTLAERTLTASVKNAASDLLAAQEAENLGQVQVEVAQLFRDAAARKAELGEAPPVQVQRAELELLRAQNELDNARAERQVRRVALNQLIGQPPETPLRVALPPSLAVAQNSLLSLPGLPTSGGAADVTSNAASSGEAVSGLSNIPLGSGSAAQTGGLDGLRAQLLPGALANRPDVAGAQATLEARQAQVGALRRERLPVVELQARRSSAFGREGSYALRAVVTLPLFDFGSLKHERRAAEAETLAQQATIALLRSQVAAQVEQALIRWRQQRRTVERYRSGIVPLAVELLRKTQIGYAAGASTYLEVLEAQRALRQTQTEYLQALAGARRGETALESALGATPPADLTGVLSNPAGAATPPGVAAPGTIPSGAVPPATTAPAMENTQP